VRRTAIGVLLFLVLAAAAQPLAGRLRAAAPPVPSANRIGVGRLLGSVLTGSFRPVLLAYLWLRGDILYGQGRHDELSVLYRTMTALYPGNARAREFLGWHLAFNLKNEAWTPELGWAWAREGLDILAQDPDARRTLADWCLKQCGQNPLWILRYAGKGWERERYWRTRLRAWAVERFGRDLDRFDLGLFLLEGREHFYDRLRRANLAAFATYEDWLRTGDSERAEQAALLFDDLATEVGEETAPEIAALADYYRAEARILRELDSRRIRTSLLESGRYEVSMALLGIGAHGRDEGALRASLVALDAFDAEMGLDCDEERELIRAWIAYVRAPGGDPPPLPFDGLS
jgi:hypothetical protein